MSNRTDDIIDPAVPHIVANDTLSLREDDRVQMGNFWALILDTEISPAPPNSGHPDAVTLFYRSMSGKQRITKTVFPGDRSWRIIRRIRAGDEVKSIHDIGLPDGHPATATVVDVSPEGDITIAFEDDAVASVSRNMIYAVTAGTRPE